MTKKHSWEERGWVISLPEKLYRQEKKDDGRGMGSLGRDLRSGLIICACSEVRVGELQPRSPAGTGSGCFEEANFSQKPRSSPGPGLICFHRPRA